jgi:Ni,Fe-hydrogenase maturation factor
MPSIVVIGYGNPLRGDDAIGWKAAEALRDVYEDDMAVEVFASHQLTRRWRNRSPKPVW